MTAVIEAAGLRKRYRGPAGDVPVLNGVTMAVDAGEVVGLLGVNGAGKSTTLRILAGLLTADAGRALIAGFDVAHDRQQARTRLGYVGQAGGLDEYVTARQNLVFQGRLHGLGARSAGQRADELAARFGFAPMLTTSPRTWSGGQRRRLALALGLMHRPAAILLDEPTVGLDPDIREALWAQITELAEDGAAVLLTTHYLEEARRLCTRALVMSGGVVTTDFPAEARGVAGEEPIWGR